MTDPWKHRSEGMKCKTCMWFCPKEPDSMQLELYHKQQLASRDEGSEMPAPPGVNLGRCRRHAPTMSGYPVVFVNDWCGDHKLNEKAI